MTDTALCRFLDWDSEFFGRRIARIIPNTLKEDQLGAILEWSASEHIDCLYFLAASDNNESVRCAERAGFGLVDVRITLEKWSDGPESFPHLPTIIRPALQSDLITLKSIAQQSHGDSRFYHDGRFSKTSCDALYEKWIENSCAGYADIVLVPELQGVASGYISCHLSSGKTGQIGLLGVAPEAQGKHLGQDLVNEALRWFRDRGIEQVTVVTQGRNCRAQRLYQRCGFVTRSLQLWYHKWF